MRRTTWLISMAAIVAMAGIACMVIPSLPGTGDDATVAAVAAKAVNVANHIGGAQGYGGTLMTGYPDHMPSNMGFIHADDLARSGGSTLVGFRNDSNFDCTFQLNYFASHMGFEEFSANIDVPADENVTFDIPCAEIIGLGSLETPGVTGCSLADGQTISNTMAVPAFLGTDYFCGGGHHFRLAPDTDDLDGDGDTEELILTSDALLGHMGSGGPMEHNHGDGIGGHFGGGMSPRTSTSPPDSNGEAIFNTGFNLDGERVLFTGGPPWLAMHGGGCITCHGANGGGGNWVMMTNLVAPDIRYSHLTEEEHGEDGEEAHPPYDDELLARAIRVGLSPADEALSLAMPRWDLSDEDMADLIEYLKSLEPGDEHEE